MNEKHKKWLRLVGFLVIGAFIVNNMIKKKGNSDSAIIAKAEGLSEFEAMRAEIQKSEHARPDWIEDLAKNPDSGAEASTPAETRLAESKPMPAQPATPRPCTQDERLFGAQDCAVEASEAPVKAQEISEIPDIGLRAPEKNLDIRPAALNHERTTPHRAVEEQEIVISDPPVSGEAKGLLSWRGLVSSKPNVLTGKATTYPGAVVRAGCRVLAEIDDELRVSRGDEHLLTLTVKGPMPGCKLPPTSGMRLTAYATLGAAESRILAPLKMCADLSPTRKSVSCNGRVKSITGFDGLEGEIYDVSYWGTILDAAIAIGSAPTIARLTASAASAKELYTAQQSADIANTLQRSASRISEKISQSFEGREIRLAAKALVIVTFEEDIAL